MALPEGFIIIGTSVATAGEKELDKKQAIQISQPGFTDANRYVVVGKIDEKINNSHF